MKRAAIMLLALAAFLLCMTALAINVVPTALLAVAAWLNRQLHQLAK